MEQEEEKDNQIISLFLYRSRKSRKYNYLSKTHQIFFLNSTTTSKQFNTKIVIIIKITIIIIMVIVIVVFIILIITIIVVVLRFSPIPRARSVDLSIPNLGGRTNRQTNRQARQVTYRQSPELIGVKAHTSFESSRLIILFFSWPKRCWMLCLCALCVLMQYWQTFSDKGWLYTNVLFFPYL